MASWLIAYPLPLSFSRPLSSPLSSPFLHPLLPTPHPLHIPSTFPHILILTPSPPHPSTHIRTKKGSVYST